MGLSYTIYMGIDPSSLMNKTAGAIALFVYIGRQRKAIYTIGFEQTPIEIIEQLRNLRALYHNPPTYCLLEKVWGRPEQSVVATSKMMEGYGFIKGAILALGIPFVEVVPKTWQKDYISIKSLTRTDHKNVLKDKAQKLFLSSKVESIKGEQKITLKNCDALLICHYLCSHKELIK